MENITANAFMRFTKIKFDRVVPAHILEGINAGYDKPISTCPVVQLTVAFAQSGEPIGVGFRLNGYTLGGYTAPAMGNSGFAPGPFMHFSPEVVAYLSHAGEEALAIVQPIVYLH
jgi:hypothetical protein